MKVRCITCEHFTLKPRTEPAVAHLRASDIAHARVGVGRCKKETLELRWQGAETEIECTAHEQVTEEQTAARREWIRSKGA
jgi:hypothetical protein